MTSSTVSRLWSLTTYISTQVDDREHRDGGHEDLVADVLQLVPLLGLAARAARRRGHAAP